MGYRKAEGQIEYLIKMRGGGSRAFIDLGDLKYLFCLFAEPDEEECKDKMPPLGALLMCNCGKILHNVEEWLVHKEHFNILTSGILKPEGLKEIKKLIDEIEDCDSCNILKYKCRELKYLLFGEEK